MIDATDRYGVKLMCGQITRLYPIYREAAAIARSGTLGRLAAVHVNNMVHIDRVRWWARSETMGALLHSPGVHYIDYLLHICGTATSVYAVESKVRVQQDVDYQDSLFLLVEFESGVIGSVQCTVSCLTPGLRGQIVGTLGSLTYAPREGWIETAMWEGDRERKRTPVGPTRGPERMDIGIRAELGSFFDWVANDAEPVLTGWDGLRAVEIIDAAYRSIAAKRPISLPLPRP
jgi:predicted dehydrogenase